MSKQLAWQQGSSMLRTFADLATRVSGLEVLLSRHVERAMLVEGRTLLLPQHSLEAEEAMAAELVACTLGARSRPELLPRDPWAGVS